MSAESKDYLGFFSELIENELGIVYQESNYFQLRNRVEEILRMYGLSSPEELLEKVRQNTDSNLKQLIVDTSTNNETSFFRDVKCFAAIEKHILPELLEKSGGSKIRIWSAACSFGQEPYSLAMLVRELMDRERLKFDIEIVATDISSRAIDKAKSGLYTQLEIQRGLSPARLVKYFEKQDENQWSLKPEIRDMIRFQSQNLKHDYTNLGMFDLVLCRNVLIYQRVEKRKDIIQRLSRTLKPDGLLIMGAGESLMGVSDRFKPWNIDGTVVYRLQSDKQGVA